MDRELVLLVLTLVVSGPALWVGALIRLTPLRARSARQLERHCWNQLWLGLTPALVSCVALVGWALAEPAKAEPVPPLALAMAAPFLIVLGRSIVRAVRALAVPEVQTTATVGLLSPRVVVAQRFAEGLDDAALDAAMKHERAHARHRDPLRLWLGQFAADLMWPLPAAHRRFETWRACLELARDEEARLDGADGADLAAAVVAALQMTSRRQPLAVATLTGEEAALRQRIRRLLRPMPAKRELRRRPAWLVPAVLAFAGIVLGASYGEVLVRGLLGGGP